VPEQPPVLWAWIVSTAAVAAFLGLALIDIRSSTLTADEPAHLIAGYTYLVAHDYRINPEHPPLLKKIAALPLLAMNVWPEHLREPSGGTQTFSFWREAWAMAIANPGMAEWRVSQFMLYGLRDSALQRVGGDPLTAPTTAAYTPADYLNDGEKLLFAGRLMMLLVGLALAALIFWWSKEIWGVWGGVVSMLLFCFDPNFIAHSGLVTTDVGAAFFVCLATYLFWKVCRDPRPRYVIAFALAFALAQTSKFSAVVLAVIVVMIAAVEILTVKEGRRQRVRRLAISIAAAAVATPVVIWALYDFRFSSVPDPEAARQEEIAARKTLRQTTLDAPETWPSGHLAVAATVQRWEAMKVLSRDYANGYSDAEYRLALRTAPLSIVGRALLFAEHHRLLPEAFLFGSAWTAATSTMRTSFLNGQYSVTGLPDYFLFTLLYKTSVPALAVMVAGLLMSLRSRQPRTILALAVPAVVYFIVASASNIHIGYRHIFPVLPFLYIASGSLATVWLRLERRRRAAAGVLLVVLLAFSSTVVLLPRPASLLGDHLSYMNELAGGPRRIDRLSDSNFDWGQDLERLAVWLRDHHIQEPINLVYFGNADPRYYGIRYYDLRKAGVPEPHFPGYFAISQLDYLGLYFRQGSFTYWQDYLRKAGATEIGRAGYGILIFRVDRRL
jgi:4-amino-4-deoxy-L-arabinose transferase-like glycosyltransferase